MISFWRNKHPVLDCHATKHAWYTPLCLISNTYFFTFLQLGGIRLLWIFLHNCYFLCWMASCHVLHGLRLGWFRASLNIWHSSLVIMAILAKSIKMIKFSFALVSWRNSTPAAQASWVLIQQSWMISPLNDCIMVLFFLILFILFPFKSLHVNKYRFAAVLAQYFMGHRMCTY